MQNKDCFSGYHPLVNFFYFTLVLLFSMEIVRKPRENGAENTAQIIAYIRQSGGVRNFFIQLSTKCE